VVVRLTIGSATAEVAAAQDDSDLLLGPHREPGRVTAGT
jgi:hypothetical protein